MYLIIIHNLSRFKRKKRKLRVSFFAFTYILCKKIKKDIEDVLEIDVTVSLLNEPQTGWKKEREYTSKTASMTGSMLRRMILKKE